jgi:hypothetical protein
MRALYNHMKKRIHQDLSHKHRLLVEITVDLRLSIIFQKVASRKRRLKISFRILGRF